MKVISGILAAGLFCCYAKPESPNDDGASSKMPKSISNALFGKFKLVVTNSSAVKDVFEGERLEDGASLLFYHEFMGREDDKSIVRELKGGRELLAKMDSLWNGGGVGNWNGFDGPNPPEILDGGGFVFTATLTDGSKISARGTNNYPKGYRIFEHGLYDLAERSILDSSTFVGDHFQITLPESWVGLVEVGYSGYGNSFIIPRKNGAVYFMRIDISSECEKRKGYRCLGKIKDKDLYVNWYSYGYVYFQKYMEENHWKAYSDFVQQKDEMMKSFVGINGYELEPITENP